VINTIKCPNKRNKPNGGVVEGATCGKLLGLIDDTFSGSVVLRCPKCASFFILNKTNDVLKMSIIDKQKGANAVEVTPLILSYRMEL